MRIETKEVMEGSHVGRSVWICHYDRPDVDKKPLRSVPPTKCIITSNEDLPEGKTVYYSKCHFRPLGKNGEALSRVVSPVDNTGFRTRSGGKLNVFDNEADCIDQWNADIDVVIVRLHDMERTAAQFWRDQKDALQSRRIKP